MASLAPEKIEIKEFCALERENHALTIGHPVTRLRLVQSSWENDKLHEILHDRGLDLDDPAAQEFALEELAKVRNGFGD